MKNKILTLLGFASKAGKITFGANACAIGIRKNKIKLIIIAGDISANSEEKILRMCKGKNIKYIKIFNREILSGALGKSNKTILGITDKNFADKFIEYNKIE